MKPTPLVCPHCGWGNDQHHAADDLPAVPHDDDRSLCLGCGCWAIFEGGGLRKPTDEETAAIRLDSVCTRAHIAWVLARMELAMKHYQ
jgi:hypothetical protein